MPLKTYAMAQRFRAPPTRANLGRMAQPGLDLSTVEVLTFDCYGTLIDWETGILTALRRAGSGLNDVADDHLLEAFARQEARLESGPWLPYRTVLEQSCDATCADFGVSPSATARASFGGSVADWPAFPDSKAAMTRLGQRFELGVITNCDDDLFALSNAKLGEPFRWIVTAEQAQSYKPSKRNFELALERIGRPREQVLHVAQSLYHDHAPAQALGWRTAWIDRRHGQAGFGATPPATATPDLVAPDMATFAGMVLA